MNKFTRGICLAASLLLLGCGTVLAACGKHKEHHWSEWKTTEPTCEEAGSSSRYCLDGDCGETESTPIPALGHDWGTPRVTKGATCTEEGVREKTCNRCKKTENETLEKLGHDWGDADVKKPATCTETGLAVYTCNNCGEKSEERELPMIPHEWETVERVNPKCETDGKAVYRCSVCKTEETVELEKLGHSWVNSGVAQEATCEEEGMLDRQCSRCKEEEKKILPALGHDPAGEYTIDVPATFEHEGSKSYHCTRCGEPGKAVVIPKLEENTPIEYTFRVFRNNGDRITDASVVITVYDESGAEVVKSNAALMSGGAFKTMLLPKAYTARLTGLPDGYSSEETFAVEPEMPYCDLYATASVIMSSPGPTTVYQVGSVVHDFTIPAENMANGKEFVLSKALEGKKMLLINFWFANCNPCKEEFPGLGRVYEKYKDVAEVLAITPYDSVAAIVAYPKNNGMSLSFPMGEDAAGLVPLFRVRSYPTSVIIDREGVVCEIFSSSTNESRFENFFKTYTAKAFRGDDEGRSVSLRTDMALPAKREDE